MADPLDDNARLIERMEAAVAKAQAAGKLDQAQGSVQAYHAALATDPEKTAELLATPGHPLWALALENQAILEQAGAVEAALDEGPEAALAQLKPLRQVAVHYAKKGDLLYPLLAESHGVSGPSSVMWTVDGRIKDTLRKLAARPGEDGWEDRVRAALAKVRGMVEKEADILFPLCAGLFTEREWQAVAFDLDDYGFCLTGPLPLWDRARAAEPPAAAPGELALPCGSVSARELDALLAALPGEVTFVGADDRNKLFDSGRPKSFKRPLTALGRPVWSCHPAEVRPMTRRVIEGFKAGTSDALELWTNRDGRDLLVRYAAVRDDEGSYLGTLEWVQDMEAARKHYGAR